MRNLKSKYFALSGILIIASMLSFIQTLKMSFGPVFGLYDLWGKYDINPWHFYKLLFLLTFVLSVMFFIIGKKLNKVNTEV